MIAITESTLNSWNKVQKVVVEAIIYNSTLNLNVEDIYPEALVHLLFADSLEFTEFLVMVEDELDINIAITKETKTLQDIYIAIEKELKCKDN